MEIEGRKKRAYITITEGPFAGEEALILKKIERQLVLYKYLISGVILEKKDLFGDGSNKASGLYGIPASTIYKDIQDLKDAGLVKLRYDAANDWYVRINGGHAYDASKDSPNRVAHLKKLRRLAWCMRFLRNDPPEEDYDDDYNIIAVVNGEKSCKDYYTEQFPQESLRTMNRDFEVLTNIGYVVKYNKVLGRYDFFEDEIDWEDDPYVPGIIYLPEYGLCHLIGEEYNMEMQNNLYIETIGLKMGLPEEERGKIE